MKIGIIGYGVVGSYIHKAFERIAENIVIYDKHKEPFNSIACQTSVNSTDLVFICVPTPCLNDGSADTSAVEDAVSWLLPPACIKSTIPPGTTEILSKRHNKRLIMSPEYIGETAFHHYRLGGPEELVVLGGDKDVAELFLRVYSLAYGPNTKYFITDSVTAELTKYMENCFFATKVAFVAQFYHLAKAFGADFNQMREMWVADSRIGRSHSMIIGSPGFDGRCLPKDLSAIIHAAENIGDADLLRAVMNYNSKIRAQK